MVRKIFSGRARASAQNREGDWDRCWDQTFPDRQRKGRQVENPRFYERTLEQIRREAVKEEERLEEQGEGQSKARQSTRETGEPAKRLPPQTLKVLHKRPDRHGAPEHLGDGQEPPSGWKDSRCLLG